jgi:N6-adenosine-specific RNA methylase IME4
MKKYNVIYADPPWEYNNKKTGRTNGNQPQGSGAATKYPTMPLADICAMKIPSEKNSVLFLWATVPMMPEAFQVMKSWGYTYKTMITWRKIMSLGMGWWWRGQTEHLLFGIKGKVKAFKMQECNFIQCKVGKHSEKPQEFRSLIERATPHLITKLELFARSEHPGWDVFGNEVNNSITLPTPPGQLTDPTTDGE